MELVSVVITCFNSDNILLETINSVLNQEYNNIEIIIIDDGSNNEKTISMLKKLEKNAVIKVYLINNKGVSFARNYGVQKSSGRYLIFIDHDDLIDKNYIKKAVTIMENDQNVALVYSFSKRFGKDNKIWILNNFSYENLLLKNSIFLSSVIKRDDFLSCGGFNLNMTSGLEDWDFWIRYLYNKKSIYRINEILFYYRIKSNSRTIDLVNSKEKMYRMYLNILVNNFSIYREYSHSLNKFTFNTEMNIIQKTLAKYKYVINVFKIILLNKLNKFFNFNLIRGKVFRIKYLRN